MLKVVSSFVNVIGALNYKGTWNANTNTPTITSGVGIKGDYYVVSVAGSTNIDGESLWGVGDWIAFNGLAWQKIDGGDTGNFTTVIASSTITGGSFIPSGSSAPVNGVFLPAANTVGVSTNSGEKLRVDENGNVSVGINSQIAYSKFAILADETINNHFVLASSREYSNKPSTKIQFVQKYNTAGTYLQFSQIVGGKENANDSDTAGYLSFWTYQNGGTLAQRMMIDSGGNISPTAGTTSMTNGFFYIPAAAGIPAGTPTSITGTVPMYYDTTNDKFYVYNGSWKGVTLS